MSLVINTNVSSLVAQYRLSTSSQTLQKSLERLASGSRINRAADDASGLSISQNLTSQIRRMQQAGRNTEDGISVLQVAEGALGVIGDNLQRVRELAVQAANDTNSTSMRSSISNEIRTILGDVDRIAAATNLNGINLLDGSATNAVLQVGPASNALTNTVDITSVLRDSSSIGIGVVGAGPKTFGSVGAIDLSSNAQALAFLTDVDSALKAVNNQRADIGAYQNKLESVSTNLDQSVMNFTATNSRIRDVDVASETSIMTQSQILTQAATMVLSQTNDLPRMILSLLQKN